MKKGILTLVMALVMSVLAIMPAMAASGLNSNEEALLKEFEAGVDTKADLLGATIVAQWKNEAANALAQVDLDANACADLSQGIKNAVASVKDITTRRGLKAAAPGVVSAVNAISQKYGMTVTVSDKGYAKVTITTAAGKTVAGDNGRAVHQTGFGMAQTAAVCSFMIVLLIGAVALIRRQRLFA